MIKNMANLVSAEQAIVSPESQDFGSPRIEQAASFTPSADSGSPWNLSTIVALLLLFVLWAVKLYTTWGAWGNLTIDSGHEMYVPAQLAQGKQLYRDVWFMYGPAAPYFTSYLYRLFGVQLNVLYWAGSLSALGSALFLYLTGMRLSYWLAGWAAGAVVLMEAFQPSLFCFPLPYASAAVYGCFTGCLFLCLIVHASFSKNWIWIFFGGLTAGVALLVKPEFGMACYATLALLIAVRAYDQGSMKLLARDAAMVLPGMVLCALVVRWMVSIAGVEFITQENIMSWPTAYFMKAYGKRWLEGTGFTVSGSAFLQAFHRGLPVAAVILTLWILLWWKGAETRSLLMKALMVFALAGYLVRNDFFVLSMKNSLTLLLTTVFFPRDMVLYIIVAAVAIWCYFWWRPACPRSLATALIFTFSGLLAFRILMKMNAGGYPIFYNGPVALSYLLLLSMAIRLSNRSRGFVFLGELVLSLACLIPVYAHARLNEAEAKDFVPLSTERGTIRVSKQMAENYKSAIQFMKEKAALGQSVLSIPEDTSLYFLSETDCPTRVYLFTPGALAPGKMVSETINQIERAPVSYLLWSNRSFPEYGVPVFGEDFDRELGSYLKSNYRLVGPLLSNAGNDKTWAANIWERKREGQVQ
jgi:hypothetical protein